MDGDYNAARAWAERLTIELVKQHPTLATTEREIAIRYGRIYIDYVQNALGHQLVAPYSLRSTTTATISTSLQWKGLSPTLDFAKFTAKTLPRRLTAKPDPMTPLLPNS